MYFQYIYNVVTIISSKYQMLICSFINLSFLTFLHFNILLMLILRIPS